MEPHTPDANPFAAARAHQGMDQPDRHLPSYPGRAGTRDTAQPCAGSAPIDHEEQASFKYRFERWATDCGLAIASGYHRAWPDAGHDPFAAIELSGQRLRELALEFYSWGVVAGAARARRLDELLPIDGCGRTAEQQLGS
jgi:hypothetical protein